MLVSCLESQLTHSSAICKSGQEIQAGQAVLGQGLPRVEGWGVATVPSRDLPKTVGWYRLLWTWVTVYIITIYIQSSSNTELTNSFVLV